MVDRSARAPGRYMDDVGLFVLVGNEETIILGRRCCSHLSSYFPLEISFVDMFGSRSGQTVIHLCDC